MNDVAKRILSIAESNNISDQELCRLLNSKKDKVNSWKIDRSKPTTDEVAILAQHFNVTTDYLLCNTNDPAPRNSTASDNITFDDFTYAMQDESGELTDDEKDMLLNMARMLKAKRKERQNEQIDKPV